MPIVGFMKMLVDIKDERPGLTEEDRAEINKALRAIYEGPAKKDPILGMVLSTVGKAVRYELEEDVAYLLDMFSDQVEQLKSNQIGGLLSEILGPVMKKVTVACADEADLMKLLEKCEDRDKNDNCGTRKQAQERINESTGSVVN